MSALIFRVARWLNPYQVLWATLGIGAVAMVALTAASVEIYEAVTESDGVAGLDRPVLDLALALRSPGLDAAVTWFTDLGGAMWMTVLTTIATVALAVRRRGWTPILLMAAATAGSLLVTVVGKALIGRVRPPLADAVPPYETSGSFPSGHALNSVVIAGLLAYLLVPHLRTWTARVVTVSAAWLFAAAMAVSRVFLGHHWLTDVLVAWTLGLAWLSAVIVAHRLFVTVRRVRRRRTASVRPPGGGDPAS
jgi:undecaprenyl-diphosphatase